MSLLSCAACTGAGQKGQARAPLLTGVDAMPVSVATGSVKWKSAPPPDVSVNHISPPCASMMPRHIDRPTPMPEDFVVMNGWNSFSRTCSDRPGPLSGHADLHQAIGRQHRFDGQLAATAVVHRLNRITDQIQQHLLNLHLVDKHQRQTGCEVHCQMDATPLNPSKASAAASSAVWRTSSGSRGTSAFLTNCRSR